MIFRGKAQAPIGLRDFISFFSQVLLQRAEEFIVQVGGTLVGAKTLGHLTGGRII
jgi:hypothetical protein